MTLPTLFISEGQEAFYFILFFFGLFKLLVTEHIVLHLIGGS